MKFSMSKKIDISIIGKIRPDLNNLFHQYLSNMSKRGSGSSFGWCDDDEESYWRMIERLQNEDCDDDYFLYPIYPKKKKHKRKKSVLDYEYDDLYYSDYESDSIYSETKSIYFYYDYHEKGDRILFTSLKEFSDFCDSMGYSLSDNCISKIIYSYESHCCVNPETYCNNMIEIVAEHSYGEMFYVVCDTTEL